MTVVTSYGIITVILFISNLFFNYHNPCYFNPFRECERFL